MYFLPSVPESLLRALAGIQLALFATLFPVATLLRCRAIPCAPVLLYRFVHTVLFVLGGLSVLFRIVYMVDLLMHRWYLLLERLDGHRGGFHQWLLS